MKGLLMISMFVLSNVCLMAQNHAVSVKLLSATPNESRFGSTSFFDYPMTYEYDSENRVCKISRSDGQITEITTLEYGPDIISADVTIESYNLETWKMYIEDNRIVKDEWIREGRLSEMFLYTYNDQDQIVKIERQVPVEPERNMTFYIEWDSGQPVLCHEVWSNGNYAASHTYSYTNKEDDTPVNFFVSPFTYMDNFKSKLMPLLYCQNYYGKRHTLLLQEHTQTYSIYSGKPSSKVGWTNTFSYTDDGKGHTKSIGDGEGRIITLEWEEIISGIHEIPSNVNCPEAYYSIDGRRLRTTATKGISIIRQSNGVIKKVLR